MKVKNDIQYLRSAEGLSEWTWITADSNGTSAVRNNGCNAIQRV